VPIEAGERDVRATNWRREPSAKAALVGGKPFGETGTAPKARRNTIDRSEPTKRYGCQPQPISASVIRATRPVPAEFVGRARAFRNRILADDDQVGAAIGAIIAYARNVLRRRHSYRLEHFQHLERAWRLTIPNTGRLAFAAERGKDSLTIVDTRICASVFHKGTWENHFGEHSLALILYSGRFTSGHLDIESVLVSAVSLHALARRFQRSFDCSDQAVLRDLSLISLNVEGLLNTSLFRQPAGDGAWHGETVTVRTCEKPAQSIVGATASILAEALALGRKGNLSVDVMLDVINQSAAASPLIGYKRDILVNGDYTPAFTVEQMMKDFDLITDAARTSHVPMLLATSVRQQYEQAWVRGDAKKDFFVLCKPTAE
jgi:hypothetical protein